MTIKENHTNIKIVFLFAIISLLSLSVFSFLRIKHLVEESVLVNHTQKIKLELNKTLSILQEVESNQRAYLYTKDPFFFPDIVSARNNLIYHLNNIASLTQENPSQKINTSELKTAVIIRIDYIQKLLNDINNSTTITQSLITGKKLMNDVTNKIIKMESEEELLMQSHTLSMNKSVSLTPLFTISLIIGSIVILISSYFKIIHELRKSDLLKLKIQRNKNELEFTNKLLVEKKNENEKRAAELNVVNMELAFQNNEKENRATELGIANKELVFQNKEKENRAAELIVANKELAFQNKEKENRAAELIIANKELESFTYISSHDLQEPLRQIQNFASRIITNEKGSLSDKGIVYFEKINNAANRMQTLISDLLAYSRSTFEERKFEIIDLGIIVEQVKSEFQETIESKNAIIEIGEMCSALVIQFQFRQLMHNLVGNALKFSNPDVPPHIKITSSITTLAQTNNLPLNPEKEYCHISITDNGIGFEPQYKDRIFEVFQRLHDKQKISGTGIGLAIVKKIVENHNGFITASSQLNEGASFDVYIPNE